jgi:hypothetical protein
MLYETADRRGELGVEESHVGAQGADPGALQIDDESLRRTVIAAVKAPDKRRYMKALVERKDLWQFIEIEGRE